MGSGAQKPWKSRYGALLIFVVVGVIVVVWAALPSSFQLVDYHVETFIDSPAAFRYNATGSFESEVRDDDQSGIADGRVPAFVQQRQDDVVSRSAPAPSPSGINAYWEVESHYDDVSNSVEGEVSELVQQRQDERPPSAPAPSPSATNALVELKTDDTSQVGIVQLHENLGVPVGAPAPSPASSANNTSEVATTDDTSGTEIVEDANLEVLAEIEGVGEDPSDHHGVEVESEEQEEKFIVPLLSYQVGTGNQLMEYKSAAVIARTLNRTLCLAPFFMGPTRHLGKFGDQNSGLYVEDRYDTEVLSRFVKITSMEDCIQKCQKRLDAFWKLRVSRPPKWSQWFNDTPSGGVVFKKSKSWKSTAEIAETLGPRNDGPKCVGLGGLFPGLTWKGVYFAGSAFLQHSKVVMRASDRLLTRSFGENPGPYLSVHWRFEESNCRGHQKGLCFSRCKDGSVIANGQHSLRWENMTREGPKVNTKDGFNGVFVGMADVSGGIYESAVNHGLNSVYLSTDGWMSNRGPESHNIVKWVVEDLRRMGLTVAGLWQIPDLPNFSDRTYVQASTLAELFGLEKTERVSNHMVSQVDQEMCERSAVFLGSGQSTWSLAVSYTRRGRRCQSELEDKVKEESTVDQPVNRFSMDTKVIETLLTVQHEIGSVCRGNHDPSVPRADDELDEAPDGWLDYAACEERMDKGSGQCTRITQ